MKGKTVLVENVEEREKMVKVKALLAELKDANSDPEFRKAVKAFIQYHTGKKAFR